MGCASSAKQLQSWNHCNTFVDFPANQKAISKTAIRKDPYQSTLNLPGAKIDAPPKAVGLHESLVKTALRNLERTGFNYRDWFQCKKR
jgi:hypothetical protein